jgi:CPA2 family monovalent cation:H+ antiporter-2
MHQGYDLVRALAIVLGVGAVASIVSHRLRQPVVLGYLLAGVMIGPHVPVPIVAEPEVVHTLSELGVILLMFYLGLEFSLRKLLRVGPSASITAIVQSSLLMWLGFATGRLFGWSTYESLFTGAIVAISSTTIIAKAFEEQKIRGKLREFVVGILIVEDLVAILLMATLTAVATGTGLSPLSLGRTAARLGAFLVALVVVGLLLVPRAVRKIISLQRPELTVTTTVALCFGGALLARQLGYSVALGAFLAGSLVAESGEEHQIVHLIQPLRDVFGAVFFVSVGMMMDPRVIVQHWLPVVVLSAVVILGKITSVTLGAFLTGNGLTRSIQTGMSLAQIGEFSFIIAGLGLSLHATSASLFPIAVAVSFITTLLTPWLIRSSERVARAIDSNLPRPLQTFAALYGSWLDRARMRGGPADDESVNAARRLFRMLALDAAALGAIVLTMALGVDSARSYLVDKAGLSPELARTSIALGLAALAIPFCIGIIRVSRKLGRVLVERALPATTGLDLAAAPRRALLLTLQIALVLLVAAPLVAITQPLLRGFHGAELLLFGVVVLGLTVWRTATNLQGHVRASAQVLVEALARQTRTGGAITAPPPLHAMFDALGEPVSIELEPEAPAVAKTLADLNLRGRTGATVLAITRTGSSIVVPSARERLRAGDVLVIAGTREASEAARAILSGRAATSHA